MADRLNVFPDARRMPTARTRYPWIQWMDGSVWRARRNVDFVVQLESFRDQLHVMAKRKGLKVRTFKEDATTVVFQFGQINQAFLAATGIAKFELPDTEPEPKTRKKTPAVPRLPVRRKDKRKQHGSQGRNVRQLRSA